VRPFPKGSVVVVFGAVLGGPGQAMFTYIARTSVLPPFGLLNAITGYALMKTQYGAFQKI